MLSNRMNADKVKVYFPNLNGLRFLCFLVVFLFHSFHTLDPAILNTSTYHFVKVELFGNGNIGVNFFFVLSGFLITYLLIVENEIKERINVKNFWLRRILRIWPLYYCCVFFGFFIFPFLKKFFGQVPNETANLEYYLVFLNNFDFMKNGLPDASILGVLWSIAVEEQFYFFWPIFLVLLPERRYPLLFLSIIAITIVFRAIYPNNMWYEYHTFSCIGDMSIGALGAWLMYREKYRKYIEQAPRWFIGLVYLTFIMIFFFRDDLLVGNYYVHVMERSFIAVVILLIILEQNYAEKSLFKMKNFTLMSKLGEVTYGLYCLQFVGILITTTVMHLLGLDKELWHILILHTLLSLALTIGIAQLSYKYFESYFLKLKDKFAFVVK